SRRSPRRYSDGGQANRPVDPDRRAVCEKRGMGRRRQAGAQRGSILSAKVPFQMALGRPAIPPGMFDSVLERLAVSRSRLAPIRLRDEILKVPRVSGRRIAGGAGFKGKELLLVGRGIRDANRPRGGRPVEFDPMRHRRANIVLTIEGPGDPGDRGPWNELLNEHNGSPPPVIRSTADVKPQIDFLEVAMERYRHSEDSGPHEQESDERDEGLAVQRIQFGAARHERTKQCGIDLIVEHRQVAPLGRKKRPTRPIDWLCDGCQLDARSRAAFHDLEYTA